MVLRSVWLGNFSKGVVQVRVQTVTYTVTSEKLRALNSYSKEVAASGSAGVEVGVEGLAKVGLKGAGATEEKSSGTTDHSSERDFVVELVKAGFQDLLPGNTLKVVLETVAKTHYVSVIFDGKLVADNLQTDDLQVVVQRSGALHTAAEVTLDLIPNQELLYSPTYVNTIRLALGAFQKLHDIAEKHSEVLSPEADKQLIQASVEMKAVNITVSSLLTAVLDDWLGSDVEQLYRDGHSATVFKANLTENMELLKGIAETANQIAECFATAARWYQSLQVNVRDAQSTVYSCVEKDVSKMTEVLMELVKKLAKKNDLDESFVEEVEELHKDAKKLKASASADDCKTTSDVTTDEVLDKVTKFNKKLNNELDAMKETQKKLVAKRKSDMQWSAFAFLGGPLVGAIVMATTGGLYETEKKTHTALKERMEKAADEADAATEVTDVIQTVSQLADDLSKLVQFCNLMSAWFTERRQVFNTWGTKKGTQASKVLEEKERFQEVSGWGPDQFVEWLQETSSTSAIHARHGADIMASLSSEWKANELLFASETKMRIDATKWGLSVSETTELCQAVRSQLFAGITVDKAWTRFSVDDFLFEVRKNEDLRECEDEFTAWLKPLECSWAGLQMADWTYQTLMEKMKVKRVIAKAFIAEIKDSIMCAGIGSEEMVDYGYWKGGYQRDLEWLNTQKEDLGDLRSTLITLNTGYVIRAKGARQPLPRQFPDCGFKKYSFNVQEESRLFL